MNLARRQEVAQMLRDWKVEVDIRAAGATCPMPQCGALVISYEPADSLNSLGEPGGQWEFVCQECGSEFTAPAGDLIFQSVPREWLFSRICQA